jgi:inosine-uridine nucleoside N-ribohydrolase
VFARTRAVRATTITTMTERPRILLDCDPGHDDAIAIVVAAHLADLVGITTVAGNAPLDATTRNALIVRDLLGIDVPVHAGAARPIVAEPRHADYVHGESGLDGADLPEPMRPVDGIDGVSFIIETCRATEGVWLVPVGPLTNIALALRAAPDLADRIAGISVMGGGTFGNRTAAAEFNIWADPEAAAVVCSYGGPLVFSTLDLTHTFLATPERIERVRSIGGRLAETFADLLVFFSRTYVQRHEGMAGAAVHDPCAVLALTHRHLFGSIDVHVQVETSGTYTRGMTLFDRRSLLERGEPNCTLLTSVDAAAGFALITESLAAYSA